MGRHVAGSLLVVLLALALVAAAEGLLRLYVGPFAYVSHPDTLVALKPGLEKRHLRVDRGRVSSIPWRTNADGFRGPDLRADGRPRVIVYGDSNIQARFSRHADTFVGRLERRLVERGLANAQVVNAGVAGFGPDQSLLRLEAELEGLRPDAVVLHVFADNDFGDIVRNRIFDLSPDAALVRSRHAATEDQHLAGWRSGSPAERLGSLLLSKWGGRIAAAWRQRWLGAPTPAESPEEQRQHLVSLSKAEYAIFARGEPRRLSSFADHYDIDVAIAPESPSSRTKQALVDAVLARANRRLDASGVPLLVVIQPSSRDVSTNLALNHQVLARSEGYHRRRLSSAVAAACRRHGVAFVNLFEPFAGDDPDRLYFADEDDHWNEAGQALAARVAAPPLAELLGGNAGR